MRLQPALAGPDAPLERPRGVRDVKGQWAERSLCRDAPEDCVRRQHGQCRTESVAAHVAEEDARTAKVPRQEGEGADRYRHTGRAQELIRPPPPEAGVDNATDKC